jgi:NAD(P)-dependent dehydrogenase (short-subunit alcohol dehydrogenase family)
VAVVTGAASGIGRALADRFAEAGMCVVLGDIEEGALATAERVLKERNARVVSVVVDVSKATDVSALARTALDTFGAVHVVCNNAGVGTGGLCWEQSLSDWEWVLGVNLWGVIHGVRTFVPIMLEQKTEGHIVNTASMAGLTSGPFMGIYNVSKHGVVTLSETLQQELAMQGGQIRVSVLCPGFVRTNILESERNRPAELAVDGQPQEFGQAMQAVYQQMVAQGMPPSEVADKVFQAIQDEQFYVLPHPEFLASVRARMEDILEARDPHLVLPDNIAELMGMLGATEPQ